MVEIPQPLKDLMEKQKQIQEELEALTEVFCQPGMPGLHSKLVDEEGFPRADIDIYAVRGARHRIACLKTDYTVVRAQIERELHALHARGAVSVKRAAPAAAGRLPDEVNERALAACPYTPFATIDELHEKSPAAYGGLRLGDLVLRLGPLFIQNIQKKEYDVADNTTKAELSPRPSSDVVEVEEQRPVALAARVQQIFQRLQELVKDSVGSEVEVDVFRSGKIVHCKLTPQTWEGRGLLGCRLSPITEGDRLTKP